MPYSSDDFRLQTHYSIPGPGGGQRHMLDLNILAHAANHTRGPGYSANTHEDIRSLVNDRSNFHNYNSHSANHWERSAANDLMAARDQHHQLQVTAREASHLRGAVSWLHNHRDELPSGLVSSLRETYSHAVDQNGHRILDGRQWRGY